MLTVFGQRRQFCDGVSRRDFLRIGGLAMGGLTLGDLLRCDARAESKASRHKSVIMIWLPGGPSHMDTYDLKPNAPAEYRGEFRPIASTVPGMDFCEHLPRHAAIADKLAVIRSVTGAVSEHASALLMSGYSERMGQQQGGRPRRRRNPLEAARLGRSPRACVREPDGHAHRHRRRLRRRGP